MVTDAEFSIPILGFAAFSGTGKTTLLTKLIPLLKEKGLQVGIIKHSHHRFDIDTPGKDSYRHRKAGASPVMISSKFRRAMIWDHHHPQEPSLKMELQKFDQSGLDILLVEGFKRETIPKIEIHRPSLGKPLLYPTDNCVIALAVDDEITTATDLPILDLNQPLEIADFIRRRFLHND